MTSKCRSNSSAHGWRSDNSRVSTRGRSSSGARYLPNCIRCAVWKYSQPILIDGSRKFRAQRRSPHLPGECFKPDSRCGELGASAERNYPELRVEDQHQARDMLTREVIDGDE